MRFRSNVLWLTVAVATGCATAEGVDPGPTSPDGTDASVATQDAAPPPNHSVTVADVVIQDAASRGPDVIFSLTPPDAGPDVALIITDAGGTNTGCVATVAAGHHESSNTLCSDGVDNDCDGHTDCDDVNCALLTVCYDAGTTMPMNTGVDPNCAPVLSINEVQTGATGAPESEFVEIYNSASCNASLEGFSVYYLAATGTTPRAVWTAQTGDFIGSHGYAVVSRAGFVTNAIGSLINSPSGLFAAAGGGIALASADGTVIDSMGYGNSVDGFIQNYPANAPPADESIALRRDGSESGDNSADYVVKATPSPGAANH